MLTGDVRSSFGCLLIVEGKDRSVDWLVNTNRGICPIFRAPAAKSGHRGCGKVVMNGLPECIIDEANLTNLDTIGASEIACRSFSEICAALQRCAAATPPSPIAFRPEPVAAALPCLLACLLLATRLFPPLCIFCAPTNLVSYRLRAYNSCNKSSSAAFGNFSIA